MSQDLITANNPDSVIGQGRLVFSGYYEGWDFTSSQTIPAGVYYLRTSASGVAFVAPANYGKQMFSLTFANVNPTIYYIALQNPESNLKFISSLDIIPGQFVNQVTGNAQSSSNIAHDGTNFIFVANSTGGNGILFYYSTDAISWSLRTLPTVTSSPIWGSNTRFSLKYDGSVTNKYIYTLNTANATNQIGYSTDAVTWTLASCATSTSGPTNPQINNNLTEKYLVHLIQSANSATQISTSTDAVTWNTRTLPSTSLIRNIHGNGGSTGEVYVGTTNNTTNNIITSTDAITWTSRSTGVIYAGGAVNYFDNKWVVFYSTTSYTFATSTDAITWTVRYQKSGFMNVTSTPYMSSVLNNKLFVQATTQGNILVSTDGINWDATTTTNSSYLVPQTYVNGRYYWTSNTSVARSADKTYIALYKMDNQNRVV